VLHFHFHRFDRQNIHGKAASCSPARLYVAFFFERQQYCFTCNNNTKNSFILNSPDSSESTVFFVNISNKAILLNFKVLHYLLGMVSSLFPVNLRKWNFALSKNFWSSSQLARPFRDSWASSTKWALVIFTIFAPSFWQNRQKHTLRFYDNCLPVRYQKVGKYWKKNCLLAAIRRVKYERALDVHSGYVAEYLHPKFIWHQHISLSISVFCPHSDVESDTFHVYIYVELSSNLN
jgi:hypothetical protein